MARYKSNPTKIAELNRAVQKDRKSPGYPGPLAPQGNYLGKFVSPGTLEIPGIEIPGVEVTAKRTRPARKKRG